MAEMDLASGDKTVVVLSWGMSDALQTCLGKLGTPSGRVIWVDPISDGDLPQPLAHARPVERIEAVLFMGAVPNLARIKAEMERFQATGQPVFDAS